MHTRIAASISLVILLVLFAAPARRWLIASDCAALVQRSDFPDVGLNPPAPGDFDQQLSAACDRGTLPLTDQTAARAGLDAVHALAKRFPNQPAACAAAVALAMNCHVTIYNPEECLIDSTPCNYPAFPNDLAAQGSMIADTEAACRLEPDNGYFAFLESYAYFAAKRDSDGYAALNRCARCTDWNEHDDAAYRGSFARLPWYRRDDALVLETLPGRGRADWGVSARVRAYARFIESRAAKAEIAGDIALGVQLRRALREMGALMRARSRGIGGITGVSIVNIANGRIGGKRIPSPKSPNVTKMPFSATDTASLERAMASRAELNAAAAITYLRSHCYPVDAAEVAREQVLNKQANAIFYKKTDNTSRYYNLLARRLAFTILVHLALALSLWAVAAYCLALAPRMRSASRLEPVTAWGIGLAVTSTVPILIWIAATSGDDTTRALGDVFIDRTPLSCCIWLSVASLVVGVLTLRRDESVAKITRVIEVLRWAPTLLSLAVMMVMTQSSIFPVAICVIIVLGAFGTRFKWPMFKSYSFAVLCTLALFCGVWLLATHAASQIAAVFGTSSDAQSILSHRSDESIGALHMIATSIIPAILAFVAAVYALVKRRPAAVTIVGLWRSALPWVVCVAVAGYAALAVSTLMLNDKEAASARAYAVNESQAMASSAGLPWPGR